MKLKVCIITSWFPSTKKPNTTPFVYNFAKNLGKSGIEVSIIAPLAEGDQQISKQDWMTIHRIESRFPLFSILKLLKQIRPDVIHVHAPNLFSSNAILASRIRNIPIIATVYRGEIDTIGDHVSKPLRMVLYVLRKFTLNRFDKIIALSHFSRSLALKAGADHNKISIIYNSCEESLFRPRDMLSARDVCGLENDKIIILFVGNLIKLKGIYTLIEALNLLNGKLPNSFLAIIIGQGDERTKLESLVERYGLSKSVIFVGWMPQTKLANYYNAADVFVLPSTVEGHSIALLEAMASGLPVVASDIEGNRESIENAINGLLFQSGNEKKLAECLEALLTNSEMRQQMSTVNPKIYYQKFSTDAQINNYTKVYNSLTKNRPGTKKKADLPSVILIDNYGLSFYTSYLACGLSKYNHVNLLGISEEDYRVTGASKVERISFSNIGKKLPKKNSILSIIFARQFVWFYVLSTAFFRRSKYDIVHVQGHLPTFFVFVPFLKLMHKRIVWTLHDVNLRPSSKGLRGRLELLYVNSVTLPSFIRRYADKIIVHGEFLKRQLVTLGVKEDKIVTVPIFDYGYLLKLDDNTDEQNLEKGDRDDIPAHTGYILIFGRIKPYKGIDVFIDALRIVREKLGDSNALRVLIAGRGDASYFKHLLTEHDLKYIQIRNEFIPNQKIPQIFNRSLFVVLPYTDASQSAVTSLAYTFSKPVVASSAGSISEYVEHDRTGLIFEPGNTEQLANHIIELIQNPRKCLEMGKNANQKVRQEMSLEKCSQIINETYHTH